jgi:glutathione S-transferase
MLTLYSHPLSSFCWKVLMALYEGEVPFEAKMVNLMDPAERAAYLKISPFGKIPTLVDGDRVVNETSIQIEYLAMTFPGCASLLPKDPAEALKVRALDRLFDSYVNIPVGRIAGYRMRPADSKDPMGLDAALNEIRTAIALIDREMANRTWAAGDRFTMADCAAGPALFYADRNIPFAPDYPNAARYLDRLQKRPSLARCIKDAEPYFHMVPK